MDLMRIKKEELLLGVTFGVAATFVDCTDRSMTTLFVYSGVISPTES